MILLTPCHSCRRHVRATATTRPFCGDAFDGARPMRVVRGRLTRAAISVLGASAVVVVGCAEPVYGAPVPPDTGGHAEAGTDAAVDADGGPADTGGGGNLYGAPAYGAPADTGSSD